MTPVAVTGSFDDLRFHHVRFLEEAARYGEVHVLLWSDETIRALRGKPLMFPQKERLYLVQSIRYVRDIQLVTRHIEGHALPEADGVHSAAWVVREEDDHPGKRAYCNAHGMGYVILPRESLMGLPSKQVVTPDTPPARKKVVVTGCYDWFHSGHVRFFEEVSAIGDLYVIVGHDANVRALKGEEHPMFPQEQRRYMVQAVRYVKQALISTGQGWLDAEPEIMRIRPDFYAVNEDGDKPVKREFCEAHGIEYKVLQRVPKAGLPRRQSTDFRRF